MDKKRTDGVGIISAIGGNGFRFSVLGVSDTVTVVVSVILILIVLLLFRAGKNCNDAEDETC